MIYRTRKHLIFTWKSILSSVCGDKIFKTNGWTCKDYTISPNFFCPSLNECVQAKLFFNDLSIFGESCIVTWISHTRSQRNVVQQCTQTSHPATKLDDVVLSLVKISSGIVRLKSSLQRRMASILKCIFIFLYLCHCVFLYFDICELFVVASLVPLSWMFDDSQKKQLSYFWENWEILFASKWNWQ